MTQQSQNHLELTSYDVVDPTERVNSARGFMLEIDATLDKMVYAAFVVCLPLPSAEYTLEYAA